MISKPKISIASYSFHGLLEEGMIDIFNYLNITKFRYRISMADLWSGFFPATDVDFIKKVRRTLDENDMQLANLCVDGAHIWEDDADLREKHYQVAKNFIKAGELLGAKTIRIDAGGTEPEWTEAKFDTIVKRYKEFAHRASEQGYRIGTENHWGTTQIPTNVVKLAKAVDNPAFGVLFHIGNIKDYDVEKGNELLVPYAMHTHIDATFADKCGSIMNKLIDSGYEGTFSVEHHTGKNEYEQVEWQLGAIRKQLALVLDERKED